MFYEGNLGLILKGQEHREQNVTSRLRQKCHPSYLDCILSLTQVKRKAQESIKQPYLMLISKLKFHGCH